jgi:mercuric reductase
MKFIELEIKGMTCDHCASSIENALDGMEGLEEKKVSYQKANGEFTIDDSIIGADDIADVINNKTNYKVVGVMEHGGEKTEQVGNFKANGSENHYDLIIIGGGSSAFAAAIEADGLGLNTLMINGGLPIGGTCVNVGCVPSKHLIRAAEQIHRASHSPFAGISAAKPTWDYKKIIQQKKELVAEMQSKKYIDVVGKLEHVKVIEGWAKFIEPHTVRVNNSDLYKGLKFVIATGATTNIPQIEGLKDVGYLNNESIFDLEEQPRKLAVIGAGYIALEIAQAYNRFGTEVQILHRSERILRTQSEDITDELTKHLVADGIDIQLNTKIQKVVRDGETIRIYTLQNGEPVEFETSHILVAPGTKPNTWGIGLDSIGVELTEKGHIKVNTKQESSVAHIYAVGDCTDTPAFVYTAAKEGKIAIENAFQSKGTKVDYTGLPWVVFTDPQVAGAGMDEKEAEEAGIPYEATTLPVAEIPRAAAALDTRGFIKLIRNSANNKLIGVRLVVPEGGELVMEASLAIKHGITVQELAESFHPYLTMSEGLKIAAITFTKDVAELSCCAN